MDKDFYTRKTKVIKALANPCRLMIIDCLLMGKKSVSEIVDMLKIEQSHVSKCLAVLKKNGLVVDEKQGLNVYYDLKVHCMAQFFSCVNKIIDGKEPDC